MPTVSDPAISALEQVPLFASLGASDRDQIRNRVTITNLKRGEELFAQDSPADAFYFVVSGTLSVTLTEATLGFTSEINRVQAGEAIGEVALLTGNKRTAGIRALTDCALIRLAARDFEDVLLRYPEVALEISKTLARRLDQRLDAAVRLGTLRGMNIPTEVQLLLPRTFCERNKVLPVTVDGMTVTVATADASNQLVLDDVRRLLRGYNVRLLIVPAGDIPAALKGAGGGTKVDTGSTLPTDKRLIKVTYVSDTRATTTTAAVSDGGKEVLGLLDAILVEGVTAGASDIHFDPTRPGTVVRYRVDGKLTQRPGMIPPQHHAQLTSRIKVIAQLDIAERRLPQDGRFAMELEGRPYDVRVATVVTRFGEKITMRILDGANLRGALDRIFASDKITQTVRRLMNLNSGLIMVTGPTGTGKTTTMYAALNERNHSDVAIYTAEDPIEYELPGTVQVQVNEASGLTYPAVLRSFMRLNADVLLIGEVRDPESVAIACNAALTGHLVLTSFHATDCFGTIARLRDMGAEPYVIASALQGVMNQRLIRRLCTSCRAPMTLGGEPKERLVAAGVPAELLRGAFLPVGCSACLGTGFRGRIPIFEILFVNSALREAIAQRASLPELRKAARGSWVPMSRYGALLLSQGLSAAEDVIGVIAGTDSMTVG